MRTNLLIALLGLMPASIFAQFAWQPVQAEISVVEKGKGVAKVVAHTSVGDWGTVVERIDVTVTNKKLLKNITAEDFDIVNNVANTLYEPGTGNAVDDYKDDGISIETNGNVLTIKAKPFDAEGKRDQRWQKQIWQVVCKNPQLSFSGRDVDETTIGIIDQCIKGSYTYAGITREYMLYLPKDENGNYIPNVPLFVWQIGGGEYDKDLMTAALANKCLTSLPQNGKKCATLVFAIANPNYSYSASLDQEKIKLVDKNNALQMEFIDSLIKEGKVDGSKLFCVGASSGGGCTMRFMMQFASRFKAAVPICAMDPIVPIHMVLREKPGTNSGEFTNQVENVWRSNEAVYKWNGKEMVAQPMDIEAFVKLPMYFVHAQDDTTCSVLCTYIYSDARKRLGAKDDKIRIYSDDDMRAYGFGGMLSHFSWVRMLNDYGSGEAMDWIVKKF